MSMCDIIDGDQNRNTDQSGLMLVGTTVVITLESHD